MFTILIWNKGNIFEYKFPNTSAKRKTKLAYIIHHHHSSRTWLGDHFSQQIKAYDMRQYNDKWFLREFRLAQQQHNTDNNNDFYFEYNRVLYFWTNLSSIRNERYISVFQTVLMLGRFFILPQSSCPTFLPILKFQSSLKTNAIHQFSDLETLGDLVVLGWFQILRFVSQSRLVFGRIDLEHFHMRDDIVSGKVHAKLAGIKAPNQVGSLDLIEQRNILFQRNTNNTSLQSANCSQG